MRLAQVERLETALGADAAALRREARECERAWDCRDCLRHERERFGSHHRPAGKFCNAREQARRIRQQGAFGADAALDFGKIERVAPRIADREVVFDLCVGSLFMRFLVTRQPITAELVDRIVDTVLLGYPNVPPT